MPSKMRGEIIYTFSDFKGHWSNPMLYIGCNNLSTLELKFNNVSERGREYFHDFPRVNDETLM